MNKPMRIIAILLFALFASACENRQGNTPGSTSTPIRTVLAVKARVAPIDDTIIANGIIAPIQTVSINSDTQGVLVREVDSEAGKVVSAGQVLVKLDGALLQSQLNQQAAAVEQERVALKQARDEASRAAKLKGKQVISAEAIAARQFKAATASEAVRAQQSALEALRTRQQRLVLRSPVAGTVIERNVAIGDLTGQSPHPMLVIVPYGQMALKVSIPEHAVSRIVVGANAMITLADGRQFEGRVHHLGAQIVAQSGQAEVWISFGRALNESHTILQPGLSGSVRIGGSGRAVLGVPEKALLFDGDKVSVMTIGADDRLHLTSVKIGQRANGQAEIVSGLAEGALVSLDSAFAADGDQVHVRLADAAGVQARTP